MLYSKIVCSAMTMLVVLTTVSTSHAQDDLYILPAYYGNDWAIWSQQGNELILPRSTNLDVASCIYNFDNDGQQISLAESTFNPVENLGVKRPSGTESPLFRSPSGRYVGYVNELQQLQVVDNTTQRIIVNTPNVDPDLNPLIEASRLVWSSDESILWVAQTDNVDLFVVFEDDTAQVVFLREFTSDVKQSVFVYRVVSRPSPQGMVVVQGIIEGEAPSYWIVDLSSKQGSKLLTDGFMHAMFTSDGSILYLADARGIVTTTDLKEFTVISTLLSVETRTYYARFSNTTEYVFFQSGDSEVHDTYVYRIHDDGRTDLSNVQATTLEKCV